MSKTRFDAVIHSIVGHQIMVSPDGNDQFKCALDDFESIIPSTKLGGMYTFHVKRDRIGVEHYRRWLGMEKLEQDRLSSIEQALLDLIKWVEPKQSTEQSRADRIVSTIKDDPEFAQYFTDQVK